MNFSFSEDNETDTDNCESSPKHKDPSNFVFKHDKHNKRFKGHWAGFECGLNNYVTNDFSVTPDEDYMEINTGKSWNFNLNIAQFSIPLVRDQFGIVSGVGFEWSNYHFSHDNTITKDDDNNVIVEKPIDEALKKNRLQTTYLTVPLLFEQQFGQKKTRDRLAVSVGLIGGVKLGSHTKYKTKEKKYKNKDDFYINSFKIGYTARIHYHSLGLYFNYYQTPLFNDDKGPELHPFAAGMIFSFN